MHTYIIIITFYFGIFTCIWDDNTFGNFLVFSICCLKYIIRENCKWTPRILKTRAHNTYKYYDYIVKGIHALTYIYFYTYNNTYITTCVPLIYTQH